MESGTELDVQKFNDHWAKNGSFSPYDYAVYLGDVKSAHGWGEPLAYVWVGYGERPTRFPYGAEDNIVLEIPKAKVEHLKLQKVG